MKEDNLKFIINNDNIFSIQVYVPLGSINEKKGLYGISHFLEHIKFNKSKKYNKKNFIQQINNSAISNAYTTKDHTSYYLKSNDDDYMNLIKLMNELVFNTDFKDNDIEIEKKIIEEEKMITNPDTNVLVDIFSDIQITSQENPYNKKVIGTMKDIKNMTNTKLKLYNKLYLDNYLIIISCSSKLKNKVNKICLKLFPDSLNKKIPKLKNVDKFHYSLTVRKNIDKQNNLILVFKSFSELDDNKYYIDFIMNFLLNNKNTILLNKLREETGFIYNLSSNNENYRDYGSLTIIISSNKKNSIYNIIKIVFKELYKLKKKKITKKKLDKYKNKFLNKLEYKLKDTEYLTTIISNYMFYDRDFTIDKYINMIKKINSNQLMNVLNLLFNYNTMSIATYGNYNNINYTKQRIFNIIDKNRKNIN